MRNASLRVMNAKVWDGSSLNDFGLYLEDGIIKKVAKESRLPRADRTIDGKGMCLFPGFVDVHVHLRDSEFAYKEDFLSGSSAAVAGGFTTILDMPNTSPPITTAERLKGRIESARRRILCNVGFYASPSTLKDVMPLKESGCIAYKVYLPRALGEVDYSSPESLMLLMNAVSPTGMLLSFHAEDPLLLNPLRPKERPIESETRAISSIVDIARRTKCRVHVAHLSTSAGLEIVKEAKKDGVDITCEATPHHLLLDSNISKGDIFHSEPPLRSEVDRKRILDGLIEGSVDIVASDHAPQTIEEKVRDLKPGFPGLEITLPLMIDLVSRGIISMRRMCDAMITRPCRRFKLKRIGAIEEGYRADFVLVDMKKVTTIDAESFVSKAKYSPFGGKQVTGSVHATFVSGIEVYSNGEVVGERGVGSVLDGSEISR